MPPLVAAERGYYELQIRVGKKCHRCKYFSQRTKTCDYCNIMRQSRLYTNGVRLDPRLCNKFVAGRRDYNPHPWNWVNGFNSTYDESEIIKATEEIDTDEGND